MKRHLEETLTTEVKRICQQECSHSLLSESIRVDEEVKRLEFEIQGKQMELHGAKVRQLWLRRQMCEPITDEVFRHVLRQLWRANEGPAQVAKLQLLNSIVPQMLKRIGQSHVYFVMTKDSVTINRSKVNCVVPESLSAARSNICNVRAENCLQFILDCATTPVTRLILEEKEFSGQNKVKFNDLLELLWTHTFDYKVRLSKVCSKGGLNLLKNLFRKPENAQICTATRSIQIAVHLNAAECDEAKFETWFRFPRDLIYNPHLTLPSVRKILVNGKNICSIRSTEAKNQENVANLRKMFPNLK